MRDRGERKGQGYDIGLETEGRGRDMNITQDTAGGVGKIKENHTGERQSGRKRQEYGLRAWSERQT